MKTKVCGCLLILIFSEKEIGNRDGMTKDGLPYFCGCFLGHDVAVYWIFDAVYCLMYVPNDFDAE